MGPSVLSWVRKTGCTGCEDHVRDTTAGLRHARRHGGSVAARGAGAATE